MGSPAFSPASNTTSNLQARASVIEALLARAGMAKPSDCPAVGRLMRSRGTVREETLSDVAFHCAQRGRNGLVQEILPCLSEFQVGLLGVSLMQEKHDAALAIVLHHMPAHQIERLVHASLSRRGDAVFDLFQPFLAPGMGWQDLLAAAAAHGAARFGDYFLARTDPMGVLRSSSNAQVDNTVATWWAHAIQARHMPLPELGRARTRWFKKFPVLQAAVRSVEMDQSLPWPAAARPCRL